MIEIYTDGSAVGNLPADNKVGAWAYCIIKENMPVTENFCAEPHTTNQREELKAAIYALQEAQAHYPPDLITLYSDSAYLINCYQQKWYINWQNNDWRNSKKQPVANKDLWEKLIPYFNNPLIKFEKVAGHADCKYNNRCDELASSAAYKLLAALDLEYI